MRGKLFAATGILVAALTARADETVLDQYVKAPDATFGWAVASTHRGLGFTTFNLRMSSQIWLTPAEVTPNRWEHWLRVIVPAAVVSSKALLLISGGSSTEADPGSAPFELGAAAALTGMVIAELRAVPNQPLVFAGQTRARSEDEILAYSWDRYLRTGDEKWPAQLPMTKAAVRAMDAISGFCPTAAACGRPIDGFVVGGGSKRGWTSWLAAAADRRVIGLVPLVFDSLNMEAAFRQHWQAYGFWSPAVADYEQLGIFAWFGSVESRNLMRIVDPYAYLSRLTMPKYIINAAGDEFFTPTSAQLYIDGLEGDNWLRYVPNAGHSLEGAEADTLGSIVAWAQAVTRGQQVPRYEWRFPDESSVVVTADGQPLSVKLWRATNPAARDFRAETIPGAWTGTALGSSGNGVWEARVDRPAQGWTAFFVELTYPSSGLLPLTFTTPVRVVPDTFPHPPPAASVHAATGHPLTAPEAIASAFGEMLAGGAQAAAALPLPTQLAGTSLRIRDAGGTSSAARLFMVSGTRINYLVPAEAEPGVAAVEILQDGRKAGVGQLLIEKVAPGLFSANGDGMGVAAAIAVWVAPGGAQRWQVIFDPAQPEGSRRGVPIGFGGPGEQLYLSLFGTGMRRASQATATVGGEPVGVAGPAASSEFAGLEQVNLGPLPRTLAGRGETEIRLSVDGIAANVVTVTFE